MCYRIAEIPLSPSMVLSFLKAGRRTRGDTGVVTSLIGSHAKRQVILCYTAERAKRDLSVLADMYVIKRYKVDKKAITTRDVWR